jgi:DNA-binding transcriptional regulator LsrR (DeoR family)
VVFEAATMYYLHDMTMAAIARHLKVSRSTVSRLLTEARDTGVVRISLEQRGGGSDIAREFQRIFSVRAHLVPIREGTPETQQLEQVAQAAGNLVTDHMEPGSVLGIAWGRTTSAVTAALRPKPCPGSVVVQLNGAASPLSSGIPYVGSILSAAGQAFGSSVHHFPVPAFFDYASTRAGMWKERSVQRVLTMQDRADIVLFGVGSLSGSLTSDVYAAGYLDADDLQTLRDERVVGDICTIMLRFDGSYSDIRINRRATGPTPRDLARVERRICVVAGTGKARPLLAALRTRAITDLVVDARTAHEVLELARRTEIYAPTSTPGGGRRRGAAAWSETGADTRPPPEALATLYQERQRG